MKKVVIPTKLDGVVAQILGDHGGYEVVADSERDISDIAADNSDAYALIVRSEKVTAEVIDALPNLKVVIRAGAGYNTIDTKHARGRKIDVMNTPGANANAVAEEVIAMILADARHIIPADASTREGKWEKKKFLGRELTGKTLGIVGLGNIGQLVAKRSSGFEVNLLGFDPMITTERAEDLGVTLTDIDSIFTECDYISLHVPETDETRGMVNDHLLGLMKSGATIINCARSGIIDEEAMRRARANKSIRFLNDVYAKDAAGEKSVTDIADLMLPHLGANTQEANYTAARRAAEQLIEFDEKGNTSYIVNRDIPEGLDEEHCELANVLARICRMIDGDKTFTKIETSFYGTLQPFSRWLLVPVLAGLLDDFDRSMDYAAAEAYLAKRGISYINRTPDPDKHYESSITLDLTSETSRDTRRIASIRGTITEGNLMVSRIGEFDKLYFEPGGHTAVFIYDDRPGVVAVIGKHFEENGINIEDLRQPHNSVIGRSIAIVKANVELPNDVLNAIAKDIPADVSFYVNI